MESRSGFNIANIIIIILLLVIIYLCYFRHTLG